MITGDGAAAIGSKGINYWICGCYFFVVVGSRLREKGSLMVVLFLEKESERIDVVVSIPIVGFSTWSSCERRRCWGRRHRCWEEIIVEK